MCESVHIVWFKRDLRTHDHAALAEATADVEQQGGRLLPLYIIEPGLWRQADAAGRHWDFLRQCLSELDEDLRASGQGLVVRHGEAVEVLEALRNHLSITDLWSHQETGNLWTFARDRTVAQWCREHGIAWHQPRQFGVTRALDQRSGWARKWDWMMRRLQSRAPMQIRGIAALDPGTVPDWPDPNLARDHCPERQQGGRRAGLALLDSFLNERGRDYRKAMSTPLAGETACSRLSPHLAYGSLSRREIYQATCARRDEIKQIEGEGHRAWSGALSSFAGRLHWHCHFMQKLESEPHIENRNLHRAYDGLRGEHPERLAAWSEGRTGWPFVDACMRMLAATGWINFRMRAMLMAVASYHLWMDWRSPGLVLARLFTDYEPGIHWPQSQMQSGTTGINTVRIYNPIKQGRDQDPQGIFIRRWLPELAHVPDAFIHEPWQMSALDQEAAGCVLGRNYPSPVRDHLAAAREARAAVWAVRRGNAYREEADEIQNRHGSRRSGIKSVKRPSSRKPASRSQLAFDV